MKTTSTINETFFAIRVGDPRRHKCYLWTGEDCATPVLFITRKEAEECSMGGLDDTARKVVRVKIHCG